MCAAQICTAQMSTTSNILSLDICASDIRSLYVRRLNIRASYLQLICPHLRYSRLRCPYLRRELEPLLWSASRLSTGTCALRHCHLQKVMTITHLKTCLNDIFPPPWKHFSNCSVTVVAFHTNEEQDESTPCCEFECWREFNHHVFFFQIFSLLLHSSMTERRYPQVIKNRSTCLMQLKIVQ